MAGIKMTDAQVQERVDKCYDMRYNHGVKQTNWVKWCNENYTDKSEKTYCTYWSKSTEKYTDGWKEKLNKQLDPAVNALIGLLASDEEKVRQRAVDQIFKLTGNEETRIAIEGSMDIKLNWGDDAGIQSE
tara:strand:- start:24 stop:413 length:390 start_codon:yes stop_codon:yes gene_type:complete